MAVALMLASGCAKKTTTAAPPPPPVAARIPAPAPPPVQKAGPASIYPPSPTVTGAANPDITQETIQNSICNRNWKTSSIRPPASYTDALKRKQMAAWRLSGTPADYEEDHLISLEVGGDPSSEANLWPEPWTLTVNGQDLGAHTKDLVENYIHDEVCYSIANAKWSPTVTKYHPTISIPLARGQQILATDWYACYRNMIAGKPCE